MGPTRSGEKVAKELGKSAQWLGRWSATWNWVERVAEWGDEQDRQNRITQTVPADPLLLYRVTKVSTPPALHLHRPSASGRGNTYPPRRGSRRLTG